MKDNKLDGRIVEIQTNSMVRTKNISCIRRNDPEDIPHEFSKEGDLAQVVKYCEKDGYAFIILRDAYGKYWFTQYTGTQIKDLSNETP